MVRMPFVMIDPKTGVFSVDLETGQVAQTVEFDDSHLIDLADDGHVLSIEVLTPDEPKIQEIAEQYGLVELVPDILAAIEAARTPQITTTTQSRFQTVQGTVRLVGGPLAETRPANVVPLPRELTLA